MDCAVRRRRTATRSCDARDRHAGATEIPMLAQPGNATTCRNLIRHCGPCSFAGSGMKVTRPSTACCPLSNILVPSSIVAVTVPCSVTILVEMSEIIISVHYKMLRGKSGLYRSGKYQAVATSPMRVHSLLSLSRSLRYFRSFLARSSHSLSTNPAT